MVGCVVGSFFRGLECENVELERHWVLLEGFVGKHVGLLVVFLFKGLGDVGVFSIGGVGRCECGAVVEE